MIVDDRLETVLRTPAAGKMAARTQLRQLVDLLGTVAPADWTQTHAEALDRIDSLGALLSDEERAALLRTVRHTSPILAYHFALSGPRTAEAAISAARLSEENWLALVPRLPVQTRGFLRHRDDLGDKVKALLARLGVHDFVLPQPASEAVMPAASVAVTAEAAAPLPASPVAEPAPFAPIPEADPHEGIGAIVKRIEAFRRQRSERPQASPEPALVQGEPHPRLPFGDDAARNAPPITCIDLRSDADGTIISASGGLGAQLVGHRPFTADAAAPASCDGETLRAARGHLPISGGRLKLDGAPAVAGAWRIDAAPLFARDGGRFTGYEMRLRRPALADELVHTEAAPSPADSADRLRQLLHELRTPINAIQGFAELIQQQLFGPTPHQYRSLAATIAADAARMLAGFEEVERLVKLESGALDCEAGEADARAVLGKLIAQLEPVVAPREVRLTFEAEGGPFLIGLAPMEFERLAWRLLSVMAGAAAPGERLRIRLTNADAMLSLVLTLPAALAMRDDEALFAPDASGRNGVFPAAAMLGTGFALRLAAAEARAAGGSLVRDGAKLIVAIPALTVPDASHSQDASPASLQDTASG